MARYISSGGKTVIDNPQKLERLLQSKVKGIVTGVAKDAENKLKYFTAMNLYRDYKPKRYVRTKEFANSITRVPTKNLGNGFEASVMFDPSKIHTFKPPRRIVGEDGMDWGVHMSFSEEKITDFFDEFISWMEDGTPPLVLQGRVVFEGHKAHHMIRDTQEWLDTNLQNINGNMPFTFRATNGLDIRKMK